MVIFLILVTGSCVGVMLLTYVDFVTELENQPTTTIVKITLQNKDSYLCGGFHASAIISQGTVFPNYQ